MNVVFRMIYFTFLTFLRILLKESKIQINFHPATKIDIFGALTTRTQIFMDV